MQTNDTIDTTTDNTIIEGGITVVKDPDASLIVLKPAEYATELFKPFNEQLASEKRKRTKYDIQTKEGMAKAKEVLAGLVKLRTSAEKAKAKAKKPIDQAGKEILAQYNALEAAVKAEEAKHATVIAEENARIARIEEERQRLERARIEAIEGRIEHLRKIPSMFVKAPSDEIAVMIDKMVATPLNPADYDEHLETAIGAQNVAINELRQLLTEVRDRENKDAELARLRAEDEKRQAAAKAAQAQQDQMNAIIEVQGLAAALTAAGQDRDRAAIEAALAKVEAFDPASFGPMAPMATLARDAARPLLMDLLANLPLEPVVLHVDPAAFGADRTVVVPIEADDTGVVIGQAVVSSAPAEHIVTPVEQVRTFMAGVRRTVPQPKRPTDLDLIELVSGHHNVPAMTAHAWLATFDAEAARAALAGQA